MQRIRCFADLAAILTMLRHGARKESAGINDVTAKEITDTP